ncbi:MAG: HD domain-containing protein [Ginsengibacter sp.]
MKGRIDSLMISKISDEIISLYEIYGEESYDGEPVTQMSHMIQAAMLAMEDGDIEITLGCFLHDIGHLLKNVPNIQMMGEFGVKDHESIGAAYLKKRGFSDRILAVVSMHVSAKRYLVATDPQYAEKLSEASKETLKWQGGPMTSEEINSFRQHVFFDDIIKVRLWDEKAKSYNIPLLPLSYFKNILKYHLENNILYG